MATVINDLVLEPKANPPADESKSAAAGSHGNAPAGPELERQISQFERRERDRGLRLWAH